MNPLKWFRWKVVIVFGVLFGGLYLLGLNPLAHREINRVGASGQAGARFSIEKIALGLMQGRSSFDAFQLATPRAVKSPEESARERVASADEIVCDLGMDDFLRRRFAVDEMSITKPLLRLQRRADGTLNVGDLGQSEPAKPDSKPTDWVKAIEEWAERIRKQVEERRKKAAEKKGPAAPRETGIRADYTRTIAYPFEQNPRFLVRKLQASALEIQFEDEAGGLKPPPIKNGTISLSNLSDRPEFQKDPIELSITGEIEGGTIDLKTTLDFRHIAEAGAAPVEKNDLLFKVKAENLPLQKIVAAFAGDSLNAIFEEGTVNLNAEVNLLDMERLAVRSPNASTPLFALRGVKMKAKPGSKIAGVPGDQFAKAVNEIKDLEIADLEIGGTLLQPEFKWGDTIPRLLREGGKAFLESQGKKGLEKGIKELDRQFEKNPKMKDAVEKALPGVDLKGGLNEAGAGALDSLLGRKKKKTPDPPPEAKEEKKAQ